jgi:hypothetical protein
MNHQTSQSFNFENFGAADFETLCRFGFSEDEMQKGLYGERVANGNVSPESDYTIRSL